MKRERGFSLIELLVTLAVLGVFLTMAMQLGRQAVQKAQFTSAINNFLAEYNQARQLASRLNRNVAFVFNDRGDSYTIVVQSRVGLDPYQETSYYNHKTCSAQCDQLPALRDTEDFVINSTGIIHKFPLAHGDNPKAIELEFFRALPGSDPADPVIDYINRVIIFPTGGIKIVEQKTF